MFARYLNFLANRKMKSGVSMSAAAAAIRTAGSETEEIASIFVFRGEKALIGQRRDNDKYTLPGGHIKLGESPYQGAVRELFEETNIRIQNANELQYFGPVYTSAGVLVHLFLLDMGVPGSNEDESISTKNDPDEEVYSWEWLVKGSAKWNTAIYNLHGLVNESFKALGLME